MPTMTRQARLPQMCVRRATDFQGPATLSADLRFRGLRATIRANAFFTSSCAGSLPVSDKTVALAEQFRALHVSGKPLVIFNIWDAGSAKAVTAAGARAIGLGSWSVAAAQGYEDGEQLPLAFVLENLGRIVRSPSCRFQSISRVAMADSPKRLGAISPGSSALAPSAVTSKTAFRRLVPCANRKSR